MRKISLTLVSVLLFSCGNNEVTISKEEYNKLKGVKHSEYPKSLKLNGEDYSIILGSDGHEYYNQIVGKSGYATGDIWLHYIGCKKCVNSAKK